MAKATIAGNIHIVDNPDAEGSDRRPYEIKRAIVIEFDTVEELREALKNGRCEFGGLGVKG